MHWHHLQALAGAVATTISLQATPRAPHRKIVELSTTLTRHAYTLNGLEQMFYDPYHTLCLSQYMRSFVANVLFV